MENIATHEHPADAFVSWCRQQVNRLKDLASGANLDFAMDERWYGSLYPSISCKESQDGRVDDSIDIRVSNHRSNGLNGRFDYELRYNEDNSTQWELIEARIREMQS